ncbi:hypothetical protein GA0070216_1269 [Micromonospora matsumotoense]|uniref:Uncharacterized protein n=1 Tax=Micromonospora matsumotoense TaxID=121616 RepID=A0A1C5ASP5_9ACTN|nr:hypothetical protein [Micromonospora matsumotoense]SCF48247.1 hypothetical protein GA0070216_1269 [Micromonospora matsumotoense]
MTSDTSTPAPPPGRHRRHCLVPREQLAAGYEFRYGSKAVSEYALAVRDLVELSSEVGAVDTWSRLAARICHKRSGRAWATWRKRLSRHFTTETKGPPWQTVVLVVKHTVPEPDRAATLRRLERLYEAARGEPPTDHPRTTDDPPHPDDVGPTATAPDGADSTGGDAYQIIAQLRAENASLRRTLAARNALLRATMGATNRVAPKESPRYGPLAGGGNPQDVPRQREAALLDGLARKDRNPGHFPVGPTPTNDAPAGRHRPPRIDTVSLPPRLDVVGTPPHRPTPLPHLPGGVRRA